LRQTGLEDTSSWRIATTWDRMPRRDRVQRDAHSIAACFLPSYGSVSPSQRRYMTLQAAPGLLPHAITSIAYVVHVGTGVIALVSGTIAAFADKGGRLHRKAGTVFVVSMLVMATFAGYLAVAVPDQKVNLFIGAFVAYLVATAWMTVRRGEGTTGVGDKVGLFVACCLCAPFAILTFQLAAGLTPLFKSAVPFKGPVLIAIYVFTAVLRSP